MTPPRRNENDNVEEPPDNPFRFNREKIPPDKSRPDNDLSDSDDERPVRATARPRRLRALTAPNIKLPHPAIASPSLDLSSDDDLTIEQRRRSLSPAKRKRVADDGDNLLGQTIAERVPRETNTLENQQNSKKSELCISEKEKAQKKVNEEKEKTTKKVTVEKEKTQKKALNASVHNQNLQKKPENPENTKRFESIVEDEETSLSTALSSMPTTVGSQVSKDSDLIEITHPRIEPTFNNNVDDTRHVSTPAAPAEDKYEQMAKLVEKMEKLVRSTEKAKANDSREIMTQLAQQQEKLNNFEREMDIMRKREAQNQEREARLQERNDQLVAILDQLLSEILEAAQKGKPIDQLYQYFKKQKLLCEADLQKEQFAHAKDNMDNQDFQKKIINDLSTLEGQMTHLATQQNDREKSYLKVVKKGMLQAASSPQSSQPVKKAKAIPARAQPRPTRIIVLPNPETERLGMRELTQAIKAKLDTPNKLEHFNRSRRGNLKIDISGPSDTLSSILSEFGEVLDTVSYYKVVLDRIPTMDYLSEEGNLIDPESMKTDLEEKNNITLAQTPFALHSNRSSDHPKQFFSMAVYLTHKEDYDRIMNVKKMMTYHARVKVRPWAPNIRDPKDDSNPMETSDSSNANDMNEIEMPDSIPPVISPANE